MAFFRILACFYAIILRSRKEIIASLRVPLIAFSVVAILFCFAPNGYAQDKRPVNNKQKIRENRAKSMTKKEKATTKDIAGKRLRTRNKSTAQRAVITASSPYKNKRRSAGDQAGKPIGGNAPRIRSSSAQRARDNVYPQKGPFVNNNSKKPEQAYSNKRELARLARLQTTPEPPGRKNRITPRSASKAYVTRGRVNTYWGKYSKGERAITTDVAGRPLRTKNFRSAANPVIKADNPYYGRKDRGDRAYTGTFRSGYATATRRGELPWKGDISGQPIRKSKGRDNQVAGDYGSSPRISPGFSARYMKKDFARLRGEKEKKGGGGSVSGQYKSNQPLSPRAPGIGANYMRQDQNKLRGIKPVKGGGSVTGKYKSNQPLSARAPGIGASYMRKDLGKLRGIKPIKGGGGSISAKIKRTDNTPLGSRPPGNPGVAGRMGSYTGDVRSIRPQKGGGSVSSKLKKNNNNMPIPVREPFDQRAADYQVNYKGFTKRSKSSTGFSQDGLSYSGSMKAKRPLKGGGSISGSWNNNNKPIAGKIPGDVAGRVSKFQGNLKQQPKSFGQEGLNYTGNIKQQPKSFSQAGYGYSGDMKMRPKTFSQEGYDFSGYNKTKKPLKGGGSISGRVWNNNNQPLPGKAPGGSANKIDSYQGNIIFTKKSFNRDGYDFTGYNKTKKPEKGGGSVSGKLWNNNGQPLPVKMPTGDQAGDINYAGKTRLPRLKREYVRNPNAVEEALKKHSPYETVYEVNGLMVRVKQKEVGTKPNAVKGSMPGVVPTKATVKASEYVGTMKVYWEYKHNPSSADEAQKTIKYSKSFAQATSFAGKTRLTKNYRHNPNSDKDALKVIEPARAYARIGDYQGNIKMNKFNQKKHFPDAQFAHSKGNNVKEERTIATDVKLLWSKLFKKNATQPDAVKEKVRRPRYDKKEKELWKDLYD